MKPDLAPMLEIVTDRVPVCSPRLPTANQLLKYLRVIDNNRCYTNFGCLFNRFSDRLGERYSNDGGHVLPVTTGTCGLIATLVASEIPEGSVCLMPVWTFAATRNAIKLSGLIPKPVDVSLETWQLSVDSARSEVTRDPAVRAVLVVSPFGRPIDPAPWEQFSLATGVKIIFDAAAAFDAQKPSQIPTVISLHSTKIFGIGEGGFVLSQDPLFLIKVREVANNGLRDHRMVWNLGLNAKLSEYHCAVGLAALDDWHNTRQEHQCLADVYLDELRNQTAFSAQDGFGRDWLSGSLVVSANYDDVQGIAENLRARGIDTKAWWPHLLTDSDDDVEIRFPNASFLLRHTIGLPFYRDMTPDLVRLVVRSLTEHRSI